MNSFPKYNVLAEIAKVLNVDAQIDEKEILEVIRYQAVELQLSNRRLEKLNQQQNILIALAEKLTSSIQLKENDIFDLIHSYANQIMDTDNMYIALYDEPNDFVYLIYSNEFYLKFIY
jgi:hypothetical protein